MRHFFFPHLHVTGALAVKPRLENRGEIYIGSWVCSWRKMFWESLLVN